MWSSMTPTRAMLAVAAAAGCAYVAYRVYKSTKVSTYYQECKAETLVPTGLKCESWANVGVNSGASEWMRINDVIMGGQSLSRMGTDITKKLVFSGEISTVGGGFASLMTADTCKVSIPDTATYAKIVVEGDGQQYKLGLRVGQGMRTGKPIWCHDFRTELGAIKTFWLPLNKFTAAQQRSKVEGLALKPSEIECISITLSLKNQQMEPNPHFGDGPFKVTLHEIEFL